VARVGHLFMKEMMRKKKASLGMERSGHYYFKKFFYCDSGALATLEIINFVSKLKNTFSEYIDILPKYYQTQEANFDLSSGLPVQGLPGQGGKTRKNLEKKIIKIENFYKPLAKKINKKDGLLVEAGDWWFSLRFSNSENLFRLNIEANDKKTLNKRQKELRTLILG
jgi:phosphomannomutase